MTNGMLRIVAPVVTAIVLALGSGALVAPAGRAAAAEKKPKLDLSEDVRKKIIPAQEAFNKGDWDGCLARAKEALEISTKPYDKEMSLRFMAQALIKKQDYPAYAEVAEQLIVLETVADDERAKTYPNLARIFYTGKNFEKAEKYAKLWAQAAPSADAYNLLVAVYYNQQNYADAVAAQEKALELDKAAGKEPTEQMLRILNTCYYKLGDKPHRAEVMEKLMRQFPKADYYSDLVQLYREGELDKRALLNLYRLGFYKDYISRESMFVDYVEQAMDAGAPAEALNVIETAKAKGAFVVIAQTDRNGRLMATAKQQAAEDHKLIAQLDKEARAGKNGEADVKTGLAYMSFGECDKAVEAIERGLTPERVAKVKRVDEAEMMLGICYTKLGKKDEAQKAFTAAQGDPRMAKAATLWLQVL